MEQTITLQNKIYKLVREQRDGISAIYKNGDEYVRIGSSEKIVPDLALHKKMEAFGFPVAKLIAEGKLGDQHYFVEHSLGELHLGNLFGGDVSNTGTIGEVHFNEFLKVVEKFAKAQLTTRSEEKDFNVFADGIHLDILCSELPQYKDKIMALFESISYRLADFPFVITHGDFNPNNLYPAGVIDLEDSFYGPFGFDLITALVHINYFPDDNKGYEFFARYRFTEKQEQLYFELVDTIATEAELQPLSHFKKDFEFCRASWNVVRMGKWPKIQQFRYDLFVQKFLI